VAQILSFIQKVREGMSYQGGSPQTKEGKKMTAPGTLGLPRSFYPAANGGKYHQANKVVPNALCNGSILVDTNASPISFDATTLFSEVHPIVCRKCLTKATGRGETN
jgi:hypothetical protein